MIPIWEWRQVLTHLNLDNSHCSIRFGFIFNTQEITHDDGKK